MQPFCKRSEADDFICFAPLLFLEGMFLILKVVVAFLPRKIFFLYVIGYAINIVSYFFKVCVEKFWMSSH